MGSALRTSAGWVIPTWPIGWVSDSEMVKTWDGTRLRTCLRLFTHDLLDNLILYTECYIGDGRRSTEYPVAVNVPSFCPKLVDVGSSDCQLGLNQSID